MANYGGQTLIFELPSPPALIWHALTDPAAVNQWLGETNFLAQTGLPFSLRPHGGVLPAGAGEVVAVEAPRRLVLRWRADGRVLALTILVEPAPGGSVLRVAHSDTGGVDEARAAALRHLYDQRLRAYLAGAPLPGSAPVVAAARQAPAVAREVPAVPPPPPPVAGPAAPSIELPAYPMDREETPRPPRRRRAVVPIAAGAGVVALLLVAAWTVAGASFGGAPTAGTSPTGVPGVTVASTGAPTPTATATASGTPSASATSGPSGPLAVESRVTNRQPNSLTVTVTITNRTTTGQAWRNVAVALGSANLTLSNVDSRVNYEWSGTRACFAPGPAVTMIPASGTVTFPFTVTGSVPSDVTETSLNNTTCS